MDADLGGDLVREVLRLLGAASHGKDMFHRIESAGIGQIVGYTPESRQPRSSNRTLRGLHPKHCFTTRVPYTCLCQRSYSPKHGGARSVLDSSPNY